MSNFVEDLAFEALFTLPGAFVRWFWMGKKETFWSFVKKGSFYNYLLSFLIYGAVIILIVG